MCLRCRAASLMQTASVSFRPRTLESSKQRGMRQGNHFLFSSITVGCNPELDVHGIRMPNGDAGLEPPELHFPHAAKRIRARLKEADTGHS